MSIGSDLIYPIFLRYWQQTRQHCPQQTRSESEVNRLFWKWLKENHSIAYEVVWWIVNLISVIAIIISVVAMRMR